MGKVDILVSGLRWVFVEWVMEGVRDFKEWGKRWSFVEEERVLGREVLKDE